MVCWFVPFCVGFHGEQNQKEAPFPIVGPEYVGFRTMQYLDFPIEFHVAGPIGRHRPRTNSLSKDSTLKFTLTCRGLMPFYKC